MENAQLQRKALTAVYDAIGIPVDERVTIGEQLMVCLFAYHPTSLALEPTGEHFVTKQFTRISIALQESFETLLRRISKGETDLPMEEQLRFRSCLKEFVPQCQAWRRQYTERKVLHVKNGVRKLVNSLMNEDADDEAKVNEAQQSFDLFKTALKQSATEKEADEFFAQLVDRIGKCLIMHLESPNMDAAHALRVHHVFLLLDGKEPIFPTINICFVADVWVKLKQIASDGPFEFPVEHAALRAVLSGIAGASVLSLYDTWLKEKTPEQKK